MSGLAPARVTLEYPDPPLAGVGPLLDDLLAGQFARGVAGFAEDVVWHVPGTNPLAGEHRGREAVLALIATLFASGSWQLNHHTISVEAPYRIEWLEQCDERGTIRRAEPLVSRSRHGRIQEVWLCGTP